MLVEDERDDVVLLQMYNQEEEDERKVTSIAPVGAVFFVKEPFFKVTTSGDYSLRVDHLTDVVRLDESRDPLVPAAWRKRIIELKPDEGLADALKKEGNDIREPCICNK